MPAKRGLYSNIAAKRRRIKAQKAAGKTPERMRKPGTKGAPTAKALKNNFFFGAWKSSPPPPTPPAGLRGGLPLFHGLFHGRESGQFNIMIIMRKRETR